MARVTELEKITKDRYSVHGVPRCAYFTFDGPDGNHYLTFETYGSPSRECPGKVSQSLQFDEATAAQVIDVIRAPFPSLR